MIFFTRFAVKFEFVMIVETLLSVFTIRLILFSFLKVNYYWLILPPPHRPIPNNRRGVGMPQGCPEVSQNCSTTSVATISILYMGGREPMYARMPGWFTTHTTTHTNEH